MVLFHPVVERGKSWVCNKTILRVADRVGVGEEWIDDGLLPVLTTKCVS